MPIELDRAKAEVPHLAVVRGAQASERPIQALKLKWRIARMILGQMPKSRDFLLPLKL